MKKYFGLVVSVLVLAGCGGYVKSENGSDNLVRLEREPSGCNFLYTINAEASVYELPDAYRYLENRIAEKTDKKANAYFVIKQTTRQNEWVMFGPERSYVFEAKVYNCPNLD